MLLCFRKHSIAFSADIEKMYFHVKVYPDHRDFQRFLWRSQEDGPIYIYTD